MSLTWAPIHSLRAQPRCSISARAWAPRSCLSGAVGTALSGLPPEWILDPRHSVISHPVSSPKREPAGLHEGRSGTCLQWGHLQLLPLREAALLLLLSGSAHPVSIDSADTD